MGKKLGGHAKRTTATKRSKKFNRETRALNKTMNKGKRSKGAGQKLTPGGNSSFRDHAVPIENVLNEVKESASAAASDSFDARSLLDIMFKKDGGNTTSNNNSNNKAASSKKSVNEQQQRTASSNSSSSSKKNNKKNTNNNRPIGNSISHLDSSKLELIRSKQFRDEEQEEFLREKADQAEKARLGLDVEVAVNRNRYGRHGPAHAFWRKHNVVAPIQNALSDMNFTHPTPVQEKVLPQVLPKIRDLKKDIIVSSETGSGKTLLFALPTLQHLLLTSPTPPPTTTSATVGEEDEGDEQKGLATRRQRDQDEEAASEYETWDRTRTLHTLVLSPTRELAEQIHGVYKSLAAKIDRRSAMVGCILGGMSHQKQQRIINRRPHILIATPGRVWDLAQKNEGCYLGHSISRRLHFVVLDEADRLLQSGHYQDLHHLLGRIRCEVLPSGLIVSGSSGGIKTNVHIMGPDGEEITSDEDVNEEVEHGALQSGSWDPVKNKFIPFSANKASKKQQKKQVAAAKSAKSKNLKKKQKKQNRQNDDDAEISDDEEEEQQNDDDEDEDVPEEDQDEEEQEEEKPRVNPAHDLLNSKDFIRPMVAPPPPDQKHRPITMVTSATLTLQTNFSHRNFKTKHFLRTNTVDTLARVLNDLGIRQKLCEVFDMTVKSSEDDGNNNTDDANNNNKNGKKDDDTSQQPGVVSTLHETYARCPENGKDLFLIYFLRVSANAMSASAAATASSQKSGERVIIFVNAISMLRRLYSILSIVGFRVGRLHSSMQQRSRMSFIEKFRSGELNVLIATDIASRGLDVDGIRYVVHYQPPRTTDAYIHRCGRTARCGGTGFSLLMINPDEFTTLKQLLRSMNNRSIASMEVYTPETASRQMKDLHEVLKVCLQIDKLEKEVSKTTENQRWLKRQTEGAEIDNTDMLKPELTQENREKTKAAKILRKRLAAMMRDIGGRSSTAGRAAFLSTPRALGTLEAVKKIRERTKNQMYLRD